MVHSMIPRVQCFYQKRLRQIITMAYCKQKDAPTYVPAAVRPAEAVCYHRLGAMSQSCHEGDASVSSSKLAAPRVVTSDCQRTPDLDVSARLPVSWVLGDPMSAHHSIGPGEFAKHLQQTCQVLEELSLMLKQDNAKCTLSMMLPRNRMQSDMVCFADKIVSLVKERCRCCANRGLRKCITLADSDKRAAGGQAGHPGPDDVVTRRLNMSICRTMKVVDRQRIVRMSTWGKSLALTTLGQVVIFSPYSSLFLLADNFKLWTIVK